MKLAVAIEYFGGPEQFAAALRMRPQALQRIELDAYGQILDVGLMDRVLAAIVRRRAAEKLRNGERLDPIEADLVQV